MHFDEAINGNTALATDALRAERYIATNRFKVRKNAGPKFEKRWADRKSRLAELEGFRFFTLLKRVEGEGADYSDEGDFGNYISLTVWKNKANFDAWRTGDAFKEAHGGGGITDFIKLLTTAIFILDGGPKPAFYDGLLPVINNADASQLSNVIVEGGWRKVEADGETFLEPDVFVVQNRFKVAEGKEVGFEQRWAARESKLQEFPGFVAFFLQRRDADKADDGYNFISTSIWKDKASFNNWREAQKAVEHGSSAPKGSSSGPVKGDLLGPPKLVYYEGKLALLNKDGA
jgi:heme-degrading monooxygenase HmoA